jgi:predicted nucleic acid-binding Zn ribbon protein
MITDSRQFRYISPVRKAAAAEAAVKLGDTMREVLENRISPQQGRVSAVVEAWGRLVPVGLAQHCRVAGLTGGVLKIVVDSPSYMYELQLCRCELLNELQQECPHSRIRKIEPSVG